MSNAVEISDTATIRCNLCGGRQSTPWKPRNLDRPLIPEDLQITDHRYGVTLSLLRCGDCGFIFAEGREISELVDLYSRLADPAYEEGEENRALQMRWLLERVIEAYPTGKTLLDIGAGTGLLVREAVRKGLDAVGVEPSRSLTEVAERKGLAVLNGVFPHPELAARKFDFVCLVDVIEHVEDPLELLRQCGEALTPNGVFVVVTPDIGSLTARLLRKRWWHLRLAHVGYFNRATLGRALTDAQLKPVKWFRAKWFFPISYVAERLEEYVPVRWINRRLGSSALYRQMIPLNLHDSWVVLARRG